MIRYLLNKGRSFCGDKKNNRKFLLFSLVIPRKYFYIIISSDLKEKQFKRKKLFIFYHIKDFILPQTHETFPFPLNYSYDPQNC